MDVQLCIGHAISTCKYAYKLKWIKVLKTK